MEIKELIENIFKRFEKDLSITHISCRGIMLGKLEGYIECGLYTGQLTADEFIMNMRKANDIYTRALTAEPTGD